MNLQYINIFIYYKILIIYKKDKKSNKFLGGIIIPVITLDLTPTSKDKKEQLVKELTEVSSKITGIPEQSFTVLINELPTENIGVGGTLLSNK